jgi:hypothetical protein
MLPLPPQVGSFLTSPSMICLPGHEFHLVCDRLSYRFNIYCCHDSIQSSAVIYLFKSCESFKWIVLSNFVRQFDSSTQRRLIIRSWVLTGYEARLYSNFQSMKSGSDISLPENFFDVILVKWKLNWENLTISWIPVFIFCEKEQNNLRRCLELKSMLSSMKPALWSMCEVDNIFQFCRDGISLTC